MFSGRLGILLAPLFLLPFFIPTMTAAQEMATKEPARYALIIGNSEYLEANSSFSTNVDSACDEALEFRATLLEIGWRPENIFPQLLDEGSGRDVDYLRTVYCNLGNDQIRKAIKSFISQRIDNVEENPFSVFYYAGHGAGNNGNMYIFGTDANIDPKNELRRLLVSSNYEIFGDEAVNITSLVASLDNISGQANLVFIDACRDNPLLEEYRKKIDDYIRNNPGKLTSDQIDRISITYKSQAQGDLLPEYSNIVFVYSTPPELPAADGGASGRTEFSQDIVKLVKTPQYQRVNASAFADKVVHTILSREKKKPPFQRQIAKRQGVIAPDPVFCFRGCPQPLAAWPSETVEILNAPRRKSEINNSVIAPIRHASIVRQKPAEVRLFALTASENSEEVKPKKTADTPVSDAPPVKIDFFYCTGDERDTERERLAKSIAALVLMEEPSALAGVKIGLVRARSLSPEANAQHRYVSGGNTVWIDGFSPQEEKLAKVLLGYGVGRLELNYRKPGHTSPNYLSVFICDGAEKIKARSIIYTQVPKEEDKTAAGLFIGVLAAKERRFYFAKAIEAVEKSPDRTQVRFALPKLAAEAHDLAKAAGEQIGREVKVVFLKQYAGKVDPSRPSLELWIGLSDRAVIERFGYTAMDPRERKPPI